MKPLGRITVTTIIPEELSKLSDIAYNFWWSYNYEAVDMFKSIDPTLWDKLGANPVSFLSNLSCNDFLKLLDNDEFMNSYRQVVKKFDDYMHNTNTWFKKTYPQLDGQMVAYFSAEFGLNESLPIYSGGLGVLSGDHCKSASDLGIPFTAIGLFYKQGYFNQSINKEGLQQTSYSILNINDLAIHQVLDENGNKLLINVDLPGRIVYASIWLVKVGRVNLYLLDSDVSQNSDSDRQITSRLYGGDADTRIQQEILLGIGGVKALDILGIKPSVYHMNEGHSAFLGFELIRKLILNEHLNYSEACQVVAASSVFTTHTPVPAGIDVFSHDTMDYYFSGFRESLGISRDEFLSLGVDTNNPYGFNMASLAIKLADRRNGVSKLHGEVTRRMFSKLWPNISNDEVPITHVTNGVHTLTWLSAPLKKLYDKYLESGWEDKISEPAAWNNIDSIPDEMLWQEHMGLKTDLIRYIDKKTSPKNSDILTIGFSRRFATYKRAALIFKDIDRIRKILNISNMPVRLIFAGKAHPADQPGQDVIKYINDVSRQEGFEGKVILLENYNIALARRLVQSVDVWLNNPRMPMEASGTSGQKACINGVLNLSVPDGWWGEGYNGKNGWSIGSDYLYENEFYQDNADSESLYEILEKNLIPLYYNRDENGIPINWIKMMKESVKSLASVFSTQRMVQEYTARLYVPTMDRVSSCTANDYQLVKQLIQWKQKVIDSWEHVSITADKAVGNTGNICAIAGEKICLSAQVALGNLQPDDVSVELFWGPVDSSGNVENGEFLPMQFVEEVTPGIYRTIVDLVLTKGNEYGYNFRILPAGSKLTDKYELRLVKWGHNEAYT